MSLCGMVLNAHSFFFLNSSVSQPIPWKQSHEGSSCSVLPSVAVDSASCRGRKADAPRYPLCCKDSLRLPPNESNAK